EWDKIADAAVKKAAPFDKAKLSVGDIELEAAYEGAWGANLRGVVDFQNINISEPKLFNLTVRDSGPGGSIERFLNLSVDNNSPRRADKVLAEESKLVRWDGDWPATPPDLGKIRVALKAPSHALNANPPGPAATIAQLQDALWQLNQDAVTQEESKLARAKKALEDKQNANPSANVDTEKAAVEAAKKALEAAKQAMADAVSDGSYLTINDFLPP